MSHEENQKRPGRPSKLTPDLIEKICAPIAAGNYMETAAAYAGVAKDTLYAWLRKGREQKRGLFREFSDAVERAMAEAEMRDVLLVAKAAETQWQAAAWRLERRTPQKWGRRVVELSGPEGSAVKVEVEGGGLLALFRRMAGEVDESSGEPAQPAPPAPVDPAP